VDNSQQDQQPIQPQPQPQPEVPTPPQPPVQPAQTIQPAVQLFSQTPIQNPISRKKSLLWLWIILGVVGVLIIAAAITLIVSISHAGSITKEYNAAAKTYLEDISDVVSGAGGSPDDIVSKMKSVSRPKLALAFLGSLNSDYNKAGDTEKKVNSLVDGTSEKVKNYADFASTAKELKTEYYDIVSSDQSAGTAYSMNDLSAYSSAVSDILTTCDKTKSGLENIKTEEGTVDVAKAYTDATNNFCGAASSLKTAIDQKDGNAFLKAVQDYSRYAGTFNTTANAIFTKAEDIAKDIKDLASPVQSLADTL